MLISSTTSVLSAKTALNKILETVITLNSPSDRIDEMCLGFSFTSNFLMHDSSYGFTISYERKNLIKKIAGGPDLTSYYPEITN